MIQRAVLGDPTLDQITRPIIERFGPQRIVLFGSRARGDARPDSDYDLMVEVAAGDTDRACLREMNAALRPYTRGIEVNLFLRTPERFEEQRDDPGTVDWAIAREGIVLYPETARAQRLTRPPEIRERGKRIPASLAGWLGRADEDLLNMEIVLGAERIPWSTVCFHAQQAAEKYLKAVLIARWHVPPRTHSLTKLAARITQTGAGLPDLAAECSVLDQYPVDARYPEQVPIPDEAQGRAAAAAAGAIVAAAKSLLPASPG